MTAAERPTSLRGPVATAARVRSSLPAVLALGYPGAVALLFRSAAWAREASNWSLAAAWLGVAAALALSALPSLAAFAALRRAAAGATPVRAIDALAFGAPGLYTMLRVVLFMAQTELSDLFLWVPAWAALTVVASITSRAGAAGRPSAAPELQPETKTKTTVSRRQLAHGVAAALLVAAFLLLHLGNQLLGLGGVALHDAALKALRHWYRSTWVEPMLLSVVGFLLLSGLTLLGHRRTSADAGAPGDAWRTIQLATGAGLAPFLLAHLAVVLGARAFAHANTDWVFASGGPEGLLGSLANTRLIPYYWLAVSGLVAHLSAGLRAVLLAHRWPCAVADRVALALTGSGAVLATGIVAALCGLRLG